MERWATPCFGRRALGLELGPGAARGIGLDGSYTSSHRLAPVKTSSSDNVIGGNAA